MRRKLEKTRGQKRMGRLGPKVYAGGKWAKLTTMKVVFRYGVREKLEKTRGKKRGRMELGNSLKLKGRLNSLRYVPEWPEAELRSRV